METARFPTERAGAVRRAVSEAVTNAVVHAYDGRVGLIHLTAAVTDDELIVLVADDGRGLSGAAPGAGGGRGWAVIAEAADNYVISQRATGGCLVEMRWSCTAAETSA
jgi:serine/threonine-protein kinase RsbW